MKRTHLPLNALRVFDAAARHLSFTRAADELAVTPAAVGQQIRALEEELTGLGRGMKDAGGGVMEPIGPFSFGWQLPVAMLDTENSQRVMFGGLKAATVPAWLAGILNRSYQYRGGSWNLD